MNTSPLPRPCPAGATTRQRGWKTYTGPRLTHSSPVTMPISSCAVLLSFPPGLGRCRQVPSPPSTKSHLSLTRVLREFLIA